jgi:hypothetical protein
VWIQLAVAVAAVGFVAVTIVVEEAVAQGEMIALEAVEVAEIGIAVAVAVVAAAVARKMTVADSVAEPEVGIVDVAFEEVAHSERVA